MTNVLVVDYGVGNLLSVTRALEDCGASVRLSSSPDDIATAERVVLPGVGAFGDCVAQLKKCNLFDAIYDYCMDDRPYLGICVGMQMLMDFSEEFSVHQGLKIIPGKVSAMSNAGKDGTLMKIPVIGWHALNAFGPLDRWDGTILQNTPEGTDVYFVHSYCVCPDHESDVIATVDYNGNAITAVVGRGNVYGCQFHPEKSGPAGLQVLKTFLSL